MKRMIRQIQTYDFIVPDNVLHPDVIRDFLVSDRAFKVVELKHRRYE